MAKRVYDIKHVPKGYIVGMGRDHPHPLMSHLYQGEYHDLKGPMCPHGANRDDGNSFSIWRGNVGVNGICKMCMKRARQGLDHIWKDEEEEDDNAENTTENSENTGIPADNK